MLKASDDATCPDPERLGAFLEGTLDERSHAGVARHVEECDRCLFTLRQASGFLREQRPEIPAAAPSPRLRPSWRAALAAGVMIGIVGAAVVIRMGSSSAVSRMAAAARQVHVRPFEGRIAEFDAERFSNTRSQTPESAALVAVANGILKDKVDPRSETDRRAVAIAQLIVGREAEAVRSFKALTRIDSRSARYRSDLATARIALGVSTSDAAELRRGLVDADAALRLDPSSLDALFNRALTLEHLGENAEAAAAYDAYLRHDPNSAWATEARWRLSRLRP